MERGYRGEVTTSPAIAALPAPVRLPLVYAAATAAALGLGLVTALSPVLGVAAFLTIACAWGFSRSGTFAVCAFVAVTYFEVLVAYTGWAMSPIKLAGGALIVVAALALAGNRGGERPAWSAHPVTLGCLAALVALGFASTAWAADLGELKWGLMRLVVDALVFLAVPVFLRHDRQLVLLAWSAVLAAACATVLGGGLQLGLVGRVLGTFNDPNEYAAAVAPALVLGYAVLLLAGTRAARLLAAGALLVCSWGLIASQSRGGLVAMLVAVAVLALTARGRERMRLVGASLVLAAIAAFFLAVTPAGQQSLERFTSSDSSGRVDLWRVAVEQFEANPLTGVGLNNYPVVAAKYVTQEVRRMDLVVASPRTTHNVPLQMAAELGVFGLIAYYGFLGGCLLALTRALRVARRSGNAREQVIGRALLASVLCLVTTGMFLSSQYQELLWVLLAASLSYAAFVRRRAGDEAAGGLAG